MSTTSHTRLLVVSDIHHAGAAERARAGFESTSIGQPGLRLLAQTYRRFIWMREPLAHSHRLGQFLGRAGEPDLVVANGDYTVDSAFVGVADDAAMASVRECLDALRGRFQARVLAIMGDHELGKMNLFGGAGGLRLEAYRRATGELGLARFWQRRVGERLVLLGVTSSLIALPVYYPELLPAERAAWDELRREHLAEIVAALAGLHRSDRVILFCHDPTALPYLAEEEEVRRRLPQWERTIVGHLHSELLLWQSRMLRGMPALNFLGNTVRRYSHALRKARGWKPFKVLLCPSITGIQLLKDGGWLNLDLDGDGGRVAGVERVRMPW